MQYGQVPGIRVPVSRLVQGGMRFRRDTMDWSFSHLDAVWELGCNAFDTARLYCYGESEEVLGKWANARGIRDKVVIITKGAHPKQGEPRRVTPHHIELDITESLHALESDWIDLYLLRRDDPDVPVGPIMEALNTEAQKGRIRAFGGSNWSHERLREANEYARQHGLIPFAAGSPNFCLAERVKEPWAGCVSLCLPKSREALEWYAKERLPLFSWSSLAAGFFSDRFRRDNLDSLKDGFDRVCLDAYCYEQNFQRLDRAREMAANKGCSIPQVALAYVLQQPLDIYALLGCKTVDEFRENSEALEISLTADERRWLETGE